MLLNVCQPRGIWVNFMFVPYTSRVCTSRLQEQFQVFLRVSRAVFIEGLVRRYSHVGWSLRIFRSQIFRYYRITLRQHTIVESIVATQVSCYKYCGRDFKDCWTYT